jgi:hypothetical protein
MGYPFPVHYVFLAVLWVVVWLGGRLLRRRISGDHLVAAVGFSFLGLTIGMLSGASRNPVVDATIGALLSVYGGLVAYLFSKTNDARRRQASFALIIVALTVGYGSYIGSRYRSRGESQEADLRQWYEKEAVRYKTQVETLGRLCEKDAAGACDALLQPVDSGKVATKQ